MKLKLKPISYDPELTEFNLEEQGLCDDRLNEQEYVLLLSL